MRALLRTVALTAVGSIAFALFAPGAGAVPAFARRYGTSCQTCHVAFPKNTPFGDAFRRNGYHFPGGDEDVLREEPQKLGADANKDLFPDTVWPGELPHGPPLSMVLGSNVMVSPHAESKVNFASVGGVVGLNAAAALGERISAWIGVSVMGSTANTAMVSLERAFVSITPFSRPYANVRIGRFEPGVLSFSMHRTLGLVPWILSSGVGDNPSMLEPTQLGAEVSGVGLGGRGSYSLGLVEGGGRVNLPKDLYGRLAYKLGGLRFDGETPAGEENAVNPAPWREWSLQAGAFGYSGLSSLGALEAASQDDRFRVLGGDLNALLGDANLIVAYTYAHHARPLLASPTTAVDSHQLFAQLDYVVFPWLIPTARYERRILTGAAQERLSAAVYLLARANVRVLLLAASARAGNGAFEFDGGQAGLTVGF